MKLISSWISCRNAAPREFPERLTHSAVDDLDVLRTDR